MSHVTLQRVIVRMLYDPVFARNVYDQPQEHLKGLGLDDGNISLIRSADARTWRLDPLRRARSLEALLDEYPASAALVAHTTSRMSALDAFFSSTSFHQCIQNRGRLALSFGSYLLELGAQLRRHDIFGVATLERAIASFRRRLRPERHRNAQLSLAPNITLTSVPGGTLEAYIDITENLANMNLTGAAVVISKQLELKTQQVSPEHVTVLVETPPGASGPGLSVLGDDLGRLLTFVEPGVRQADFFAQALACGAESGEEQEILISLIEDGLIQEGSP